MSAGEIPALKIAPALRPTIATARLLLRPLRAEDAEAVVASLADRGVAAMLARVPFPYRPEHAAAFIAFAVRAAAARRSLISAITRRGELIGVVSIDNLPGRPRLGYWLGRGHWGRGYGREAVEALVSYAFAVLGVRIIRAGIFTDNPASLRLLRKVGFRAIGRRPSRSLARAEPIDFVATILPRKRYMTAR